MLPHCSTRADRLVRGRTGNYFAVQLAMTLGSQASESNAFLFALMDKLEVVRCIAWPEMVETQR